MSLVYHDVGLWPDRENARRAHQVGVFFEEELQPVELSGRRAAPGGGVRELPVDAHLEARSPKTVDVRDDREAGTGEDLLLIVLDHPFGELVQKERLLWQAVAANEASNVVGDPVYGGGVGGPDHLAGDRAFRHAPLGVERQAD